jgi:hypothetical protein
MIGTKVLIAIGLGQVAEIGRIRLGDDAHLWHADLEPRERDVGIDGHAAVGIRHVDLGVRTGQRVFHGDGEMLRVERIFLERKLGREAALIANDVVAAAVRHDLRRVVEFVAAIVVGGEAVHELHGFRRVGVGALPAKPDIEVDNVVVGLEVELLDVVDVSANDDLGRRVVCRLGSRRHPGKGGQRQNEYGAGGKTAARRHRSSSSLLQ